MFEIPLQEKEIYINKDGQKYEPEHSRPIGDYFFLSAPSPPQLPSCGLCTLAGMCKTCLNNSGIEEKMIFEHRK